METFNEQSFPKLCSKLTASMPALATIAAEFGYPPIFQRALSFETLVHIILEQQVSLASAHAALQKLKNRLTVISPENLLTLDVAQLRNCSVSRQKAGYLLHLAETVGTEKLELSKLTMWPDDVVRTQLMQIKGIGPWTADVVLMLCLQRSDVFPIGDVALINSMRHIHKKPAWTLDEIAQYAQQYAPNRTIATYFYWHAYIKRKNMKLY